MALRLANISDSCARFRLKRLLQAWVSVGHVCRRCRQMAADAKGHLNGAILPINMLAFRGGAREIRQVDPR